jgi:uncharacterized protein (DUF1330 family)
MPKGYLIARVTITNPEAYAEYMKGGMAALRQYGGKVLAPGKAQETLEGEHRALNVIVEFESFEQAKRFYSSPEYQDAKAKRMGAAIGEFVVVEGVE